MNVVKLARNTVSEFGQDECTTRAAAIAYSAFFSLFPLLLGGTAIAALFIESADTRARIVDSAISYLPGSAGFVQETLDGVRQERGAVGVVSAALLLFSGRGAFVATIDALNHAFESPEARGFIENTLLAVGMIFGVGSLLVLSLSVTAIMQTLGRFALFGIGPFADSALWSLLQTGITITVSFLMFMLLYRIGPNVKLPLRELAPGALVAALLFEAAKWGFVVYVANFTNYQAVYGAIGAVIVLLTWCYFSSIILLIGAELTSEYVKLRRAEVVPAGPTRPPVVPLIRQRRSSRTVERLAALGGAALAVLASAWAVIGSRRTSRQL